MTIKVRPAGLEPATPCLEDRFQQFGGVTDSRRILSFCIQSTNGCVVEACGGFWKQEDLISTKLSTFTCLIFYEI